jgi:3-hydroxybutyryl-CoA dehydratase
LRYAAVRDTEPDARVPGGKGEKLMSDVARPEPVVGLAFEEIELGMSASTENTVTERDIQSFADITGDRNPVHLDADYAERTLFKGRISHGMLTASYISAVFGMRLPGPGAIYVTQTLNFRRPVWIDDRIKTTVTVAELFPQKRRVRFDCVCTNSDGKTVLEGQAMMMVPEKRVGAADD